MTTNPNITPKPEFYLWWPILLGPIAMISVYLANGLEFDGFNNKRIHETLALIILPLSCVSFGAAASYGRKPMHLILTVLTLALFCREWHFVGTSTGIYIALGVIGAWTFHWREKIKPALQYLIPPLVDSDGIGHWHK